VLIDIKVITNSSRQEVVKRDDHLVVKVHASPEKGKANKEVVELLSNHFNCPKSCIEIIKGEKSNKKRISVSV
jgi:uncharacterized protein (TIGR00251 family)